MMEIKRLGRSAGPLSSQPVITDGNWHRIGLVWDGSNGTLRVDALVVAEDAWWSLEGQDYPRLVVGGDSGELIS